MSGYGSSHPSEPHRHAASPISVPWVVLSSLLIGGGLLTVWWWITTFQWLFLLGVVPTVLGGLMLFDRRAGMDRA